MPKGKQDGQGGKTYQLQLRDRFKAALRPELDRVLKPHGFVLRNFCWQRDRGLVKDSLHFEMRAGVRSLRLKLYVDQWVGIAGEDDLATRRGQLYFMHENQPQQERVCRNEADVDEAVREFAAQGQEAVRWWASLRGTESPTPVYRHDDFVAGR